MFNNLKKSSLRAKSMMTMLTYQPKMTFKSNFNLLKPASYHDQMHQRWQQNPASVDMSWNKHF